MFLVCNLFNKLIYQKGFSMNKLFGKNIDTSTPVGNRILRLVITLAILALFVMAAGAPGGLGPIGM